MKLKIHNLLIFKNHKKGAINFISHQSRQLWGWTPVLHACCLCWRTWVNSSFTMKASKRFVSLQYIERKWREKAEGSIKARLRRRRKNLAKVVEAFWTVFRRESLVKVKEKTGRIPAHFKGWNTMNNNWRGYWRWDNDNNWSLEYLIYILIFV